MKFVRCNANVDPGADAVARLFLNFCRVLAVHIAARVHASQHRLTLSPGALAEVLAAGGREAVCGRVLSAAGFIEDVAVGPAGRCEGPTSRSGRDGT